MLDSEFCILGPEKKKYHPNWVIFLFSVDHLKFGMMLALMAGEESTIRSW